jgi:hypothetical protein
MAQDVRYFKCQYVGALMIILGLISPLTFNGIWLWNLFYIDDSLNFFLSPLGFIIIILCLITVCLIISTMGNRKYDYNKITAHKFENIIYLTASFLNLLIMLLFIVADYRYVLQQPINLFLMNIWGYHFPHIGFYLLYFGPSVIKLGLLVSDELPNRKFIFKPKVYLIFMTLLLIITFMQLSNLLFNVISVIIVFDLIYFLVNQ